MKTPVLGSFFSKVAGLFRNANLSKQKETPTKVFFVKFVKFLRTPILKNICERLVLNFYFGRATLAKNKMRFIDIANTFHKDKSSRPKLFCNNVVFKKFRKITKITCWASFWKKQHVAVWLTRDSYTGISCEFYKSFKNTYFKEPLWMAAYCLKINHLPQGDKKR